MLVYRVEDRHGLGPYVGDGLPRHIKSQIMASPLQPMPGEDGISYSQIDDDHYFGFGCLATLSSWFNDEIRDEIRVYNRTNPTNWHVGVYEIDPKHVVRGTRQVIFKRHLAEKVNKLCIFELK